MENQNHPEHKTETFKSESSIFVHPIQYPRQKEFMLPTWSLLTVVIPMVITFIILKPFLHVSDDKKPKK